MIDLQQLEGVTFIVLDQEGNFLDSLERVEGIKQDPATQHVVIFDDNPPKRIQVYSRTNNDWQYVRIKDEDVVLEMAIYLFDREAVSMREAAGLADLSLEEFIEQCGTRQVPIIRLDDEELRYEFRDLNSKS